MRFLLLAVVVAPVVVAPAVAVAGPKLTLDQAIAKALEGPKARMARGDVDGAAARIEEANAARFPRIKATAFGTASPDIKCIDPQCVETDSKDFTLKFSGAFGGGQIDLVQPLFTFGKLSHARAAATAGLEAQRALADEAANDIAVDTARAYWGLKLARELGYMLDDGIDEIDKAQKRLDARTGANAPTIQDKQRIALLAAEAKAQRAEAMAGERQALAGLRVLTGIPDADIDEAPLAAVEQPVSAAGSGNRAQTRAAKQGAVAADHLAELAAAYYFPDFALVGTALIAKAHGVQDPPSAFANDPFNRNSAGLALALQWTIEPWTVHARVEKARADARKAHALAELAESGARYDIETALAEAEGARAKVAATVEGEKAGHAWVISVVQADAIGAAEPKDFADAYIAWFQVKARWAQSVFQWNVAILRVARATGEFHANGNRVSSPASGTDVHRDR